MRVWAQKKVLAYHTSLVVVGSSSSLLSGHLCSPYSRYAMDQCVHWVCWPICRPAGKNSLLFCHSFSGRQYFKTISEASSPSWDANSVYFKGDRRRNVGGWAFGDRLNTNADIREHCVNALFSSTPTINHYDCSDISRTQASLQVLLKPNMY